MNNLKWIFTFGLGAKEKPSLSVKLNSYLDKIRSGSIVTISSMSDFPMVLELMSSETDPTGKSPHELGAKLDAGKAPLFRGCLNYFPNALREVALVSEAGAKKYTWMGWRSVENGFDRYSDALARHLLKEGEELDEETGLLHAAHLAWNALARLELKLVEKQKSNLSP